MWDNMSVPGIGGFPNVLEASDTGDMCRDQFAAIFQVGMLPDPRSNGTSVCSLPCIPHRGSSELGPVCRLIPG
jgi:hypothetical protein